MEGTVHYLNHFPIQLLNELSFKLNTAIEAWNKWNKWVEDKLFKKEEKKKDKEKKNREEKKRKEEWRKRKKRKETLRNFNENEERRKMKNNSNCSKD